MENFSFDADFSIKIIILRLMGNIFIWENFAKMPILLRLTGYMDVYCVCAKQINNMYNEDEGGVLFGSSIIFNIYTHSLLLGIFYVLFKSYGGTCSAATP